MKKIFTLLAFVAACYNSPAQTLPTYAHIVIMWDENRNYSEIIGSHLAPYINSLTTDTNAAVFSNYYALLSGSQPNYLQLFSGTNQGITSSAITTTQFTDCNLGASLIANSYTFVGYSDSLPSVGFLGTTSGNYARKHNPWSNWQGTGTDQLPASVNQPFTAFPSDFDSLPTVSFVVPDLLDDMHTPSDSTAILPGDTWLHTNLDAYIQWAKTHNSLMILGFDESSDMTEHIPYIFIGQGVRGGYYSEYCNNYRTLRTIEQMYHLPYCANSDTASAITSVWSSVVPTAVKNITEGSAIKAWPVPAGDVLNLSIRTTTADDATIAVIDQLGRTVKTATLRTTIGDNTLTIDTHDISTGTYFVKATGEELNFVERIVVAH